MKEKGEFENFSKKERAAVEKELTRLDEYLSGIRDMKERPGAVFVVDLKKEHIAVSESNKVGIPVVAIADTNTDPGTVSYPIPGNDDSIRSIKLFCDLVADAYKEGSKVWDKKKVLPEETKEETKEVAPEKTGPAVMQMARRLVAAGTADDVEIKLELDEAEDKKEDKQEDEEDVKDDG